MGCAYGNSKDILRTDDSIRTIPNIRNTRKS